MSSTDLPGDGLGPRHLLWIAAAAAAGFLSSYVFADLLRLPATMYHLVYFVLVCGFVALYAARADLPLRATLRRRLGPALLVGTLGGLVLMQRVLAEPASSGPQGLAFVCDLLWRGLIYGALDGVLLSAFPWLVTWRALGGESSAPARQAGMSALALGFALVVTSAYHLGYADFRGPKLLQANIGNAIATVPTLLSRNPLASPLAHAILHVTAVMHNPQSDLFLPPHELRSVRPPGIEGTVETTSMAVVDCPLRGTWRAFSPPDTPPTRSTSWGRRRMGATSPDPWRPTSSWPAPARIGSAGRNPSAPLDGAVHREPDSRCPPAVPGSPQGRRE